MQPGTGREGNLAKRFTDTGIWVDKPWFIELSPVEKCAWFFIKDRCDNVGVWKPNFKLAGLVMGDDIDWDVFLQKCNGNIEVLDNGKWWLLDFCYFQYGELKETCKPHQSYILLLKRHGLYQRVCKGYVYPTRKGKGKGTGTGQEGHHRYGVNNHVLLTDANYSDLCDRYGKPVADEYIQKVDDYCENHGKSYTNWVNAVHTYIRNDEKSGKLELSTPREHKKCPACGGEMLGKQASVCMKCGWSKSRPEMVK